MSGGDFQISVLTAGRDRPYALGLAAALAAAGAHFDFIGSDEVDSPELHASPQIRYLNLRGDQSVDAGLLEKVFRVLAYYRRLLGYAFTARPKVFHILWNNKFELFDRTALMLFYRLLGKKIVFTAHNVNARARDGGDSWLNRTTLKFQYHRCDHIFLHTEKMKAELVADFGVPANKTSVIPFGINSTVPDTALTRTGARQKLGLADGEKTLLFFGNIAPYKGVEFLVDAFISVASRAENYPAHHRGPAQGQRSVLGRVAGQNQRQPRARQNHFEDRICAGCGDGNLFQGGGCFDFALHAYFPERRAVSRLQFRAAVHRRRRRLAERRNRGRADRLGFQAGRFGGSGARD